MMDIRPFLEKSSRDHQHLCPRQILGVRVGLAGMCALGLTPPLPSKQMFVIAETDGCFVDGVIAATGCTVGHRTLRLEDFGKIAATFIDVRSGRAVRVAPRLDARDLANQYAPSEPRHYFAQLKSYQVMPTHELLTVRDVTLKTAIEDIISRAGIRASCHRCGEEIINEREVLRDGYILCRACAGSAYYEEAQALDIATRCDMRQADVLV